MGGPLVNTFQVWSINSNLFHRDRGRRERRKLEGNLFPPIHHSTEAFQTTIVESKLTRSKITATTQSVIDSSFHNVVALREPPLSAAEATTQNPNTVPIVKALAATATPHLGLMAESTL
ncbi:unnamed protein product [Prunus armeniaca]